MNNQEKLVMRFFLPFVKKNVRLTKVRKVSNHIHSQPVEVGGTIEGKLCRVPKVGESFNIEGAIVKSSVSAYGDKRYDLWCTSIITNFISWDTFETKNSICKCEIIY